MSGRKGQTTPLKIMDVVLARRYFARTPSDGFCSVGYAPVTCRTIIAACCLWPPGMATAFPGRSTALGCG
jgi:hypothetical protein